MPDAPQTYAVRLTAQARQDIFHAAERLAELANDPPLARAWAEALYEAATFPTDEAVSAALREWLRDRQAARALCPVRQSSAGRLFDDAPTVTRPSDD